MEKRQEIKLKLSSKDAIFDQDFVNDLFQNINNQTDIYLMQTPVVEQAKGIDPVTTGAAIVAIMAGTVPVMLKILYDSIKTELTQEVEIEVTHRGNSMRFKMRKGDEEYMLEQAKRIQELLNETS